MTNVIVPERKLAKLYFGMGVLLYMQFFVVYGATNWLASESSVFYGLYFYWEKNIPFIPEFILPYLSLSLFIILPVFFIDLKDVMLWAKTYMLMVFFAGLIFLIFPTEHAVLRSGYGGDFELLFNFLYTLDLPHNLFPSLHVSLSTLALLIMLPIINSRWIFFGIGIWWLAMAISVIFIRQHHVPDILGGILLAWFCYHYIYLKNFNKLKKRLL